MLRRAGVAAFLLAIVSVCAAEGSFSARLAPLSFSLEINIEQQITQTGGWRVYAGSGFAASPEGVEKLAPYTLACRELDVWLAYSEFCVEGRAPIVGEDDWLVAYLSVVW